MDLQPLAKRRKIRLSRIAVGGIDRKARRDDDMRPGAQKFERSLIADLHARAGYQRVLAVQVRALLALGVVEVAARLAHGIVVAMHFGEGLLADVAIALFIETGPAVEVFRLRRFQ